VSSLKVEVVRVENIISHPNADRLEIAQIRGWQCIVQKGAFQAGDLGVYLPIDSILPVELEQQAFPPESKIKLDKHRIKTIKLRGAIGQGLLLQLQDVLFGESIAIATEGDDLTELLGVTKYEPPVSKSPQSNANQVRKWQVNPNFHKYTDIENWRNFPTLFAEGKRVWVLEKIHGSNFRAGYVPTVPNTWWKRIKKWFGLLPAYEFVYGSHNVQLQDRFMPSTWHQKSAGTNIYLEAVERYKLRDVLSDGEVVYGEIYGDGVQKGYLYDCQPGERKMVVFDVMVHGQYCDHIHVMQFCQELRLLTAPVDAQTSYNQERVSEYVVAPSRLGNSLREGVVIKPVMEQRTWIGRKILKWKNSNFELAVEDDTH